jgi:uncharacterized protein (TIGR02453 family)
VAFTGFSPELLDFFMGVRLNNSKAYMDANREVYKRVAREPFLALAAELAPVVARIDPALEVRPERVVSRINRDTRFSKDKSPYRDHLWIGYKPPKTRASEAHGFFFDVTLEGYHYGCGIWGEVRPLMNAFRDRVEAFPDTFRQLLSEPKLKDFAVGGDLYKKDRKPEIDADLKPWVNRKSLFLEFEGPLGAGLFTPQLAQEVRAGFEAMAQWYRFVMGI